MRKRAWFSERMNRGLVFFATALVVLGVAGAASLSSMRKPPATPSPLPSRSSSVRPLLVLVNESANTILFSDGSSERMTRAEFDARFPANKRPIEGVNAANGSVVQFENEFRSPDGIRLARLETPKGDAASVVTIEQPQGSSSLVLRVGRFPLRDARIHGWSDAQTLFVSALVTSTRAVFRVDIGGSVRKLATLPDTALFLEVQHGALWYITASPGEGIESEPAPPSEAHRIRADTGDDRVVREDSRLILHVVPSKNDAVAYLTDDGQVTFLPTAQTASKIALGKRQPLLFLDDGRLVMRDDLNLQIVDPRTGASISLGALPEGRVEIYALPQAQ